MARLGVTLGHASGPAQATAALAAHLRATLGVDDFFLAAYDEAARIRRCVLAHSAGEVLDAAALPPLPLNAGPASRAIAEGRTVATGDYQAMIGGQFRVDVGMHKDPRAPQSAIAAPVRVQGRVLGTLEVQSPQPHAFGPAQVHAVEAMAAMMAPFLASAPSPSEADPAGHALARGLVREMLHRIARRGGLRPEVLRGLGRELGGTLRAGSVDDLVRAYASMGLGELRVDHEGPDRVTVRGRDLLERAPRAAQPGCLLTLGFLEGAIGDVRGHETLGTEIACESQGRDACVFVLRVRRGEA